jgi:CHAT domain-containing protein
MAIRKNFKYSRRSKSAIAAYTQSVNNLKALRSDLVAISSEVQFSFRESVEPVYRELVSLLLDTKNPQPTELEQARQVIESLQLAELDNFFRDACLDTKPVKIDELDPTAAIVYTIILKDRLEVIVKIPQQPLKHYSTQQSQLEIENTLEQLRSTITIPGERYRNQYRLQLSQTVYNWLIKPIETDLKNSNIRNLVFISDGLLRNIPLAALYDGQEYLIQKYAVTLTPGLELIDPQPLTQQQRIGLLGSGISEARPGFDALPNVELELNQIQAQIPKSILLINDNFTKSYFSQKVKETPYQIIHLATHGQFSSQVENTFILTWDDHINIAQLNSLIRTDKKEKVPLELLVLSACQTAAGDNRATLGLAGIAVRAGARSTLASLWSVDDEATALLMSYFYQQLSQSNSNKNITKAEAIRQAQLAILEEQEFNHPYYWSAFVLLGNWL